MGSEGTCANIVSATLNLTSGISLSGSDVYISGTFSGAGGNLSPAYYLNGILSPLPIPSTAVQATTSCVLAYGSDLYVGGVATDSSNDDTPGYWLNGNWVALAPASPLSGGTVQSIVVVP